MTNYSFNSIFSGHIERCTGIICGECSRNHTSKFSFDPYSDFPRNLEDPKFLLVEHSPHPSLYPCVTQAVSHENIEIKEDIFLAKYI